MELRKPASKLQVSTKKAMQDPLQPTRPQSPASDRKSYLQKLWKWTDFSSKTGWQWINLLSTLVLPVVVVILGAQFNKFEEERKRAFEQQQKQDQAAEDKRIRQEKDRLEYEEEQKKLQREELAAIERNRNEEAQRRFVQAQEAMKIQAASKLAQERAQFDQRQQQEQTLATRRLEQEKQLLSNQQQAAQRLSEQQQNIARETAFRVSQENLKDSLLTEYIDQMKYLLITWDLQKRKPTLDIAIVARTLTLTALSRLNGWANTTKVSSDTTATRGLGSSEPLSRRKRQILQFLYEAKLLRVNSPNIDLKGADFSGADLAELDLSEAYLVGVNFSGSSLKEANLKGSNLRDADLRGADLSEAVLAEVKAFGVKKDAQTRWPAGFSPP